MSNKSLCIFVRLAVIFLIIKNDSQMLITTILFRHYKHILILILIGTISFSALAQKKIPKDFCIKNNEIELYNLINKLRVDYGKTKLQLSASLSYVAELHINDLQNNHPDTSICNLSSWSDKGDWTPCCYTKYLHKPDCMWDKPKELTPYPYRGYELVLYIEDDFNTDTIINLWADSKEVLDMILTRGNYENKKWICSGVAIGKNYVSLWFGQRRDKLKKPEVCNFEEQTSDTTIIITTENKPNTYYLVFGSFDNIHDAKEAYKTTKADNFPNCDILEKNNKYRIYLNKYNSMKEAMFAKQQLSYLYREAWILKD